MKQEWVSYCIGYAQRPAHFYSGCRKIIRGRTLVFEEYDDTLQLSDAGYTKAKLSHLVRLYLHEASRDMAVDLWQRRRDQGKYGSVGFTTYNHLLKSDPDKKSKRASVMGPCIQSVVLTWLSRTEVSVDAFWRTTELLKKFPADLVFLRDVLLHPFNFEGMRVREVRCHFANITVHPMYWITVLPHIPTPTEFMDDIKKKDEHFYRWLVKWSARYICPEYQRGIAKFAQAMRVKKDALDRIDAKTLKLLQAYFRDNHPGYRGEYIDPEEDEDGD